MPKFKYDAVSASGKKQSSTLEAADLKAVRAMLRTRKLFPTQIKELAANQGNTSIFSNIELFKPQITTSDLVLVIRQLSTLVSAGITLEKALHLMLEQADNKNTYKFIATVKQYLAEGQSFTNALKQSNYRLPAGFVATIEYAEETGNMDKVLQRLADDLEQQAANSSSLVSALIYPAFMIVVAIAIVSLLMVYVVPQVTKVFMDSGKELPGLTVAVIAISDFVRAYGSVCVLAIFGAIVAFILALQKSGFKLYIHHKMLGIPTLGSWIMLSQIARWSRSLGVLLGNGVPALQSMTIASHGINNVFLHSKLEDVLLHVREGKSLHRALEKTKIFPGFLIHMVSTGESSGSLDAMLIKTADYYEQKLKITISTVLKVFDPILILCIGGLVMLIVLAILMPIFELNQLVV